MFRTLTSKLKTLLSLTKKLFGKLTKSVASINKKVILSIMVVLILSGGNIYFYNKYKSTSKIQNTDPEVQKLLDSMSEYIMLPNEIPTIATISDTSKLGSQEFYKNAQIGDKVIVFNDAQKAILYRPEEKKIINFSSATKVEIDTNQLSKPTSTPTSPPKSATGTNDKDIPLIATSSPTIEPTKKSEKKEEEKPLALALYNSTKTNRLTYVIEEELNDRTSIDFEVTSRGNSDGDYTKTIVIDLTGKNKDKVEHISKVLDGKVSSLPKDENKPSGADILIIIGAEYAE